VADAYACLYRPPAAIQPASPAGALVAIAQEFSPRYERHHDDLVTVDISGLERLLGAPQAIAEALGDTAVARGVRVNIALACTHTTALVLARARSGLTVVPRGEEAAALAPVGIEVLDQVSALVPALRAGARRGARADRAGRGRGEPGVAVLRSWGLRTLGELAALPAADLAARLGERGRIWRAIARGEDPGPLVPVEPEEPFEASLDLEWPIEAIEPLSFVLTRLLEPLSIRLEQRDRGAAALHVELRLVTRSSGPERDLHARRLDLPFPFRDARTLRTLARLDLESHPPAAAVDRVTVRIDPTPARVIAHTLFVRAHPTPDALSTLLARLGALTGQDRIGAPALVDAHRPGLFAMRPFATDRPPGCVPTDLQARVVSGLRRCRQPVPARVAVESGRPVRLTTDRRGFTGGRVTAAAGPWRTSGGWWAGKAGAAGAPAPLEGSWAGEAWDRDEWEMAVSDGAIYRVFRDRGTGGWFIDAIVD
jgi:protein ImuB